MAGPPLDPVETDGALPPQVDVAIIGGGIIGMSTALALVQMGLSVVVCEKGHIAGEQSSRNWGWCRVSRRDPREIPLAIEAARMWQGLNELVQGETGYRQTGILFGCDTAKAIADAEEWLEHAKPFQLSSRMIGPAEAAELLPGAARHLKGALYTPGDGRAEPQKVVPAITKAVRRLGGSVVEHCAVRALHTTSGRAVGVLTERGCVAASAVVLAGGAWSRLFALGQKLRLPQLKVQNTVVRTEPLDGGPEGAAWIGEFSYRRRLDGGYTLSNGMNNIVPITPDSFRFAYDFLPALLLEWQSLHLRLDGRFLQEWRDWRVTSPDEVSPFEKVRVLDPEPVATSASAALKAAQEFFPQFRYATIAQRWAGMIEATPDALPVISGVDQVPGFFIATGFSGHGFGIGPAAGRLCADLVTGANPIVDPAPFRFTRFSDGTRPRPMSGV
jgi:glycine/D-amino acid oxidase-like deaminating enzyme